MHPVPCPMSQVALKSWTAAALVIATAVTAEPASFTLSNGNKLPAVGLGVGNLDAGHIDRVVREAVGELGISLIDTAHRSMNEHVIAEALTDTPGGEDVLILTKVWYTHLGFERTVLSVEESLAKLRRQHLDVVLLHWPRCRDDIPWMHCSAEEQALPANVKEAGPPPHAKSWRDSWRALEHLSRKGIVKNIGVSNFDLQELRELVSMAEIKPDLIQQNVWSTVNDPHLMQYLAEHSIHFQAYNVLNSLQESKHADSFRRMVEDVALSTSATPQQVLLQGLVEQGVSVVARSSSTRHLRENAAVARGELHLSGAQQEQVTHAFKALIRGSGDGSKGSQNDEKPGSVTASFSNSLELPVRVFWTHPETGENVPASPEISPGGSEDVVTYPGHRFLAEAADGSQYHFHVDETRRPVFRISRQEL